MAALLSSVLDNSDKVSEYTNECAKIGIKVLPPNVNESLDNFTVSDGNIRFGLLAIKNLGRNFIKSIISERRVGKFTSFYNFCSRIHGPNFNKRAVESLIRSGSLDGMGANRRQMLSCMNEIIDDLDSKRRRNIDGQIGLFDMSLGDEKTVNEPKLRAVDEFSRNELLAMEKVTTGLYLSGHPMAQYDALARELNCSKISELVNDGENGFAVRKDGEKVRIMGIITSVKKKVTKSDTTMAFISVEDIYGTIEVIVFPKTLLENPSLFEEGKIAVVSGRLDLRDDEPSKLICEFVTTPEAAKEYLIIKTDSKSTTSKRKKRNGLFLKFSEENTAKQIQAEKLLAIFDGNVPVYFYFENTKKYVQLPAERFVCPNEPLIKELKNVLGDKNVVIQ